VKMDSSSENFSGVAMGSAGPMGGSKVKPAPVGEGPRLQASGVKMRKGSITGDMIGAMRMRRTSHERLQESGDVLANLPEKKSGNGRRGSALLSALSGQGRSKVLPGGGVLVHHKPDEGADPTSLRMSSKKLSKNKASFSLPKDVDPLSCGFEGSSSDFDSSSLHKPSLISPRKSGGIEPLEKRKSGFLRALSSRSEADSEFALGGRSVKATLKAQRSSGKDLLSEDPLHRGEDRKGKRRVDPQTSELMTMKV